MNLDMEKVRKSFRRYRCENVRDRIYHDFDDADSYYAETAIRDLKDALAAAERCDDVSSLSACYEMLYRLIVDRLEEERRAGFFLDCLVPLSNEIQSADNARLKYFIGTQARELVALGGERCVELNTIADRSFDEVAVSDNEDILTDEREFLTNVDRMFKWMKQDYHRVQSGNIATWETLDEKVVQHSIGDRCECHRTLAELWGQGKSDLDVARQKIISHYGFCIENGDPKVTGKDECLTKEYEKYYIKWFDAVRKKGVSLPVAFEQCFKPLWHKDKDSAPKTFSESQKYFAAKLQTVTLTPDVVKLVIELSESGYTFADSWLKGNVKYRNVADAIAKNDTILRKWIVNSVSELDQVQESGDANKGRVLQVAEALALEETKTQGPKPASTWLLDHFECYVHHVVAPDYPQAPGKLVENWFVNAPSDPTDETEKKRLAALGSLFLAFENKDRSLKDWAKDKDKVNGKCKYHECIVRVRYQKCGDWSDMAQWATFPLAASDCRPDDFRGQHPHLLSDFQDAASKCYSAIFLSLMGKGNLLESLPCEFDGILPARESGSSAAVGSGSVKKFIDEMCNWQIRKIDKQGFEEGTWNPKKVQTNPAEYLFSSTYDLPIKCSYARFMTFAEAANADACSDSRRALIGSARCLAQIISAWCLAEAKNELGDGVKARYPLLVFAWIVWNMHDASGFYTKRNEALRVLLELAMCPSSQSCIIPYLLLVNYYANQKGESLGSSDGIVFFIEMLLTSWGKLPDKWELWLKAGQSPDQQPRTTYLMDLVAGEI